MNIQPTTAKRQFGQSFANVAGSYAISKNLVFMLTYIFPSAHVRTCRAVCSSMQVHTDKYEYEYGEI